MANVDSNSQSTELAIKKDIVISMLRVIGEDPEREGLKDTPSRVARSWSEIFGGYKEDPAKILRKTFTADGYDEMIMLKNVEFFSMCEHHILPFFGKITVAYIPEDRVAGISKIARVIDVFAYRLQIQERMTVQIADAINDALDPKGVMVVIEAQHLCMMLRGVEKQGQVMTTSAVRGVFLKKQEVRGEFFGLKNQ